MVYMISYTECLHLACEAYESQGFKEKKIAETQYVQY